MGWTSYHKDSHESAKDNLIRECLTWNNLPEIQRPSVVASASGPGGVFAFAVKYPKAYVDEYDLKLFVPDASGAITTALVFLTQNSSKDYYNFSYKDMGESCGPFHYVSASILKHLSPVNPSAIATDGGKWVLNWREGCKQLSLKQKETRQKKIELKDGVKIKFPELLNFGIFKEDTFIVTHYSRRGKQKLGFYSDKHGQVCRITAKHLSKAQIVA